MENTRITYLAGQPEVPCAQCGVTINRRGKGGQGHRKYCSKACRATANRLEDERKRRARGAVQHRTDGICPRCGTNLRPQRPDGRLRGWCHPCESQQKGEYCRSTAGKATWKRFYVKGHCWWCVLPPDATPYQRNFCSTECTVAAVRHLRALGKL